VIALVTLFPLFLDRNPEAVGEIGVLGVLANVTAEAFRAETFEKCRELAD